jgi:hypothetical protein
MTRSAIKYSTIVITNWSMNTEFQWLKWWHIILPTRATRLMPLVEQELLTLSKFTPGVNNAYAVYNMNPSNLCCLRNGPINLTLLTVWTHRIYAFYSIETFYMINSVNLRCWQYGPIQPFLQPDTHKPDTRIQLNRVR